MFRAFDAHTATPIILLDEREQARIDELRQWGRSGRLVCPGCREPVRVRAGEVRRWHFAHKHRRNCPLSSISPAVTHSKALLYPWLKSKYGDALVFELEKEDSGLPRPIDFFVETKKGNAAFWIMDKTVGPDDRELLRGRLGDVAAHVQWVFAEEALREGGEGNGVVDLTKTLREFRTRGRYDEPYAGGSLHYLLREPARVRSYRGLRVVHAPQRYGGQVWETPLGEMLVHGSTGEFVHPGDHERLEAHRQAVRERERRERRRAEQRRKEQEAWAQARRDLQFGTVETEPLTSLLSPSRPRSVEQPRRKRSAARRGGVYGAASKEERSEETAAPRSAVVCTACGRETTQWSIRYGQTGRGKCRACVSQR